MKKGLELTLVDDKNDDTAEASWRTEFYDRKANLK